MHTDSDSPLYQKINLVDVKGLRRPLHLSTFVASLRELFSVDAFKELRRMDEEEGALIDDASPRQLLFVKNFWNAVKETWGGAFENIRDYLLLRAAGTYVLNWLAADIFKWCRKKGVEIPSKDDIKEYLERIRGFDWSRESSVLRGLSGMSGAREAYWIVLAALAEQGVEEAHETLKDVRIGRRREQLSEDMLESLRARARVALGTS